MGWYFGDHAGALKKRHTAIKSTYSWYKTIDCVTHSLTGKPKLYIADIKNTFEPVLDKGGDLSTPQFIFHTVG